MISIIVPVYNGAQYLGRAIDSVLSQAGEWEMVIVDDHSTDSTADIIRRYAAKDSRIRFIESYGKGVTVARIAGARAASGEYLFFLDADDEIPQGTISEIQRCIATGINADIVMTDIMDVAGCRTTSRRYAYIGIETGRQLFDWIVDHHTGYIWGKAIRRDLFLTLPYVPVQLKFCEDYVQMLQLSMTASRVTHAGIAGYVYHQNPDSACNSLKTREEYARQFLQLSEALTQLVNLELFHKTDGCHLMVPADRLKVLFLYYARLYLAVAGKWKGNDHRLRSCYRHWMWLPDLRQDSGYDVSRRRQTIAMFYLSPILSPLYIALLRYRHHRIR